MLSPNLTKTIDGLCAGLAKVSHIGDAHLLPNSYCEFLNIPGSALLSTQEGTPLESFVAEFFVIAHNNADIPFCRVSYPQTQNDTSSTIHITVEKTFNFIVPCLMSTIYACHPELGDYSEEWVLESKSLFPEKIKEGYILLKNHILSFTSELTKPFGKVCSIFDQETAETGGVGLGLEVVSILEPVRKMALNPYYGPAILYMSDLQVSRFVLGLIDQVNTLSHSGVHLLLTDKETDFYIAGGEKQAESIWTMEKE